MKEASKIYFTAAWIVSLVVGILYSITFIGLLFGIPLFIASGKFNKAKDMTDEDLIKNRGNLFGWGVFLAIVLAPTVLGLIAALIFITLVNNYIVELEKGNVEVKDKSFGQTLVDSAKSVVGGAKEASGETLEQKLEELNKLKEKGVITEEEYQAKRKQILNID